MTYYSHMREGVVLDDGTFVPRESVDAKEVRGAEMANEKYTIDARNAAATLDIIVAEEFESVFSLANDNVTLSERPDEAFITIPNYSAIVDAVLQWIRLLERIIHPAIVERDRYIDKIHRTGGTIKADYEFKGVVVTDAVFVDATQQYIFAGRDEIVMGWADFIGWADFLDRFRKAVAA